MSDIERRAKERVGKVLNGKWVLDALLGLGGMAAVYAATHRNQKRAAVKILHPELSTDRFIRERFLREGYVANTVRHPGAVAAHDDDIAEDGSAYLVMELLEGATLDERAQAAGGQLPLAEVLELTYQLLDTLAAAHDRGVLHRDLKPENLFLTSEGDLKVMDFGIAKLKGQGADHITQTGDVMGTPAYMAPEQARGRWSEVDARTDLWAVGAVMFTLLTGEMVHDAESTTEALVKAVTKPAPSVAERRPDLPAPVVALVDRALAFERDARFEDARAMRSAVGDAFLALTGKRLTTKTPGREDGQARDVALATTVEADSQAVLRLPRRTVTPTATGVTTRAAAPRRRAWLTLAVSGAALAGLAVVLWAYPPWRPTAASTAVESPLETAAPAESPKSTASIPPTAASVAGAASSPSDGSAEATPSAPASSKPTKTFIPPAVHLQPSAPLPTPLPPAPPTSADPYDRRR